MTVLSTLAAMRRIPTWILSVLDWIIGLAERLVVIAIACVGFYIGWGAFHTADQTKFMKDMLNPLSENWRALLPLLIPLFYRTVRAFLERVEKFAGMETGSRQKQTPDSDKGE